MKLSLLLLAVLGACSSSCTMDDAPSTFTLDVSAIEASERADVLAGAKEWTQCGVTFAPEGDVVISIRSATVRDRIGNGWSNPSTGEVILWTGWGEETRATAAHEVGHVVLHTWDHLDDGLGVMSAPHAAVHLTQADRDFACAETNVCCHGAVSNASN